MYSFPSTKSPVRYAICFFYLLRFIKLILPILFHKYFPDVGNVLFLLVGGGVQFVSKFKSQAFRMSG